MAQGEYRQKRPGVRLTCPISRMGIKKLMKTPATPEGTYARKSLEDQKRSFLGQEINLGRLEESFTFLKRITSNHVLERQLSRSKDKYGKVVAAATNQTEHFVGRILP